MTQFIALTSDRAISDAEISAAYHAGRPATFIEPTATRTVRCGNSVIIEFCGAQSKLLVEGPDHSARRVTLFDGDAWVEGAESFLSVEMAAKLDFSRTRIHGAYRLIRMESTGRVITSNDPLQALALYWAERKGIVAISDRAGLLRAALQLAEEDPTPAIWMSAIGFMVGNATHTKGISRCPVGGGLSIKNGEPTVTASTDLWAKSTDRSFHEKLASFRQNVITALRLTIAEQGEIKLGLTGGKDSRLLLALLYESGLHRNVQFYTWDMAPEAGGTADVRVARLLAESFDLKLEVIPGRSARAAPIEPEAFSKRLSMHVGCTDGLVGMWDYIAPGRYKSQRSVAGLYGEALRHAKSLNIIQIANQVYPFDMLLPDARVFLKRHAADELSRYRYGASEPGDPPDIFYITQRLPNWAGINYSCQRLTMGVFSPLYNLDLLSLPFSVSVDDRKAMRLHYDLMVSASEELARQPFANDQWSERLCQPTPPLLDPSCVPSQGAWQYNINTSRALRRHVIGILDKPFGGWWAWVDRSKLLDLLRSSHELNAREIQALFGLLVTVEWKQQPYPTTKIKF